jgi:Carboxypeptidase regulatory-like domain
LFNSPAHQITQSPNHQITQSPDSLLVCSSVIELLSWAMTLRGRSGRQSITRSPNHPITRSPDHAITRFTRFPLLVPLVSILAARVLAQGATGEIRIAVTDTAGLPVATSIEVTSESNQLHQRLDTDSSGRAAVSHLPDGVYHLRVQHPGFTPHTEKVEIRSALPRDVRIVLDPAAVQMAVTVTGDTLVDPRQTTMIARIGGETIAHRLTPLPGRSMLDLVSTQPGWLLEANGILHPRGSEYQTQYLIDGVPFTDNRSPAFISDFDVDTVQALRVMTASYPAEYGRKLGGVVDVVTRAAAGQGMHGGGAAYGGSDRTLGGSAAGGVRSGRFGISGGADAGRTDRFLDPPVGANYSNDGGTAAAFGSADVTVSDRNRVAGTFRRGSARFLVPNEQVQQLAGQRQERRNTESAGQLSYQYLAPRVVIDVRGLIRSISAGLTSNAASTPIVAAQDRGYAERYVKAAASLQYGRHDLKLGGESDFATIREAFSGRLADRSRFPPATPDIIEFAGRAADREHAVFAQDLLRAGAWTVAAGLRWDRYAVLVHDRAWSPRLGIAYDWSATGLVVRGSYDRVFQTPAFENLLVSSSPELGDFGPGTVRLPVPPSRGHFLEAGVTRAIAGALRADANVYRRTFSNYADDELLLNTGIGFPVSFQGATINGVEARLTLPHWRGVSGSFSYSLLKGVAERPITGGLFLPATGGTVSDEAERFPITQDQRHTISTRWRYEFRPSAWVAAGASFGSGLPTELEDTADDLREAYGPEILDRVDFESGRVRPSFSLNASAGAMLHQRGRQSFRLQGDVVNIFNRLNLINFAGLFSGTALGAPRRVVVRLQVEF